MSHHRFVHKKNEVCVRGDHRVTVKGVIWRAARSWTKPGTGRAWAVGGCSLPGLGARRRTSAATPRKAELGLSMTRGRGPPNRGYRPPSSPGRPAGPRSGYRVGAVAPARGDPPWGVVGAPPAAPSSIPGATDPPACWDRFCRAVEYPRAHASRKQKRGKDLDGPRGSGVFFGAPEQTTSIEPTALGRPGGVRASY